MPDNPREAVVQRLCSPPISAVVQHVSKDGVVKGWARDGMPQPADPKTIVFRKERAGTTRRIFAVSYSDSAFGHPHFDIVGVNQQEDGSWSAGGGAGGSGGGPVRDKPWVNFAGWWGVDLFCAGGQVIGTGADQAQRVELSFVDGTTVGDSVDDGVVLFLIEHSVELPATAITLDVNGVQLSTQEFP